MIGLHCGLGNYREDTKKFSRYETFLNKLTQNALKDVNSGLPALDICTSPHTNAGIGSNLTQSKIVEMEAGIMDGESGLFGGVSCIRSYKNPILIAKCVLLSQKYSKSKKIIIPQHLSGTGAELFARANNFSSLNPDELVTKSALKHHRKFSKYYHTDEDSFEKQVENKCTKFDTVGAICVDLKGNIAVAASTGGVSYRQEGRIGHVSLPGGSGVWVDSDNKIAACTTGLGELMASEGLARKVCKLFDIKNSFYFEKKLDKLHCSASKRAAASNWPCIFGGICLQSNDIQRKLSAFLSDMMLLVSFSNTSGETEVVLLDHINCSDPSRPLIQQWSV